MPLLALAQVVGDFIERVLGSFFVGLGNVTFVAALTHIIHGIILQQRILFIEVVIRLMPMREPDLIKAAGVAELGKAVHGAVKYESRVNRTPPAQIGDGGIFFGQRHPS